MPGQSARENGKKGGRPKGSLGKATLDKIAAREHLRQRVTAEIDLLLDSQLAHAKGIKFLMARAKNGGKFERVTQDELDAVLAGQDDGRIILEVWDKDPSVQAFTDLMNRALDKPKEQEMEIALTVTDSLQQKVHAARARAKSQSR